MINVAVVSPAGHVKVRTLENGANWPQEVNYHLNQSPSTLARAISPPGRDVIIEIHQRR